MNESPDTRPLATQGNDDLVALLLHLADTNLILAQRNSEWCGHGPVLEQDIAITNISLDLIGQARNFYQYAAQQMSDGASEDSLAYLRTEREFRNFLLVELPNGDWGQTILRQFLFSNWQYHYYLELQESKDAQLSAIAAKGLKEVSYHLRWSSEWVIRLGDGTEESHQRMLKAMEELWSYTGEFFIPSSYERSNVQARITIDPALFKDSWEKKVREIFDEATLPYPGNVFQHSGGKNGVHTEHLGYILTELQYMQRTYPNATW